MTKAIQASHTVVGTGTGQEIGHEGASLRNPLLVPGPGLEGTNVRHVLVVVRRVTAGLDRAGNTLAVGPKVAVTVGLLDRRHGRGAVGQGGLGQTVGDVGAIDEAGAAGHAGGGGGRDAVEGVVLLAAVGAGLEEGGARLLVREIGLPRVGEQGKDGGDAAGRARLTRRDHDAQVHEVVVELAAIAAGTGLDDVDIFAAH